MEIKMENWVFCLDCDQLIAKIYCDFEKHGQEVHKAMRVHRAQHPRHASFRVMPAPRQTLGARKKPQTVDAD
jgi:hypothetical protein